MLTYGNLVDYFRPRWIVWENVDGVLSSNGGYDFFRFVSMLDEYGYGLAWRILDAQYFGIPQRRRRIFVIGHYRDVRYSASVLFDTGNHKKHIKEAWPEGGGKNNNEYLNENDLTDNDVICVMDQGGSVIQIQKNITGTFLSSSARHKLLFYIKKQNILRRITPLEAERLQGFPDNWTMVPYKNRPSEKCPDGPRYRAIGNSMAVPVMRWIGKRIILTEKIYNEE
jgi:DNA (cytosine-5)-methyltransferase 1